VGSLPFVSIVVPVFNEQDTLRQLHAEVLEVVSAQQWTAEIIYVDDCSCDRSAEVLRAVHAASRGSALAVRILKLRRNYGQTAAMAAGFDAARGEIVVPLDADLQNSPTDIPRLVEKLGEGFDVVSGWRRHRKDRMLVRRLPSVVANWLIGLTTGIALHDFGCTLKAYRKSMLSELKLYGEMHRFIPVYLGRLGARITELEVDHRSRSSGQSKYSLLRAFNVVLDLVLVRFMSRYSTRPMHFFGQAALLFAGLAGLAGGLMVVFKLGWTRAVGVDYQADFVETPLPALAGSLFVGCVLSLFSGILGEILIRVHYESQGIRPYSIEMSLEPEDDHE